jgi:hypothetical protein
MSVNKCTRKYGGSTFQLFEADREILFSYNADRLPGGSEMLLQLYGIINVSAVQCDKPRRSVCVVRIWLVANCTLPCNSELFIPSETVNVSGETAVSLAQ